MPVPGGYGRPMLDYIGALHGRAFAIETKAPGKEPSPRQQGTIGDMRAAGIMVFVIDDTDDYPMTPLVEWTKLVSEQNDG